MDIASAAAIVNSINKLENKGKETVKVVVRCRPLFGKEIVEGRQSIVTMDLAAAVVSIKCPDTDQLKNFTFDSVYDENTVQSIFEGYNGTIFAYGQTGCGKTHTMQGKDSPPELRGVIPHAFDHVFDNINADTEREYMVRATYLEIYNEDIRDLLSDDSNKQKLELKESADGGVYVKDLTEVVVRDVVSINKYVNQTDESNRTVGATLMNEGSSRSHSIFTIVVEVSEKINGEERFRAGKVKTMAATRMSWMLSDSLGGNTKTVMVAAISPADYNFEETLSTLRYANRAKNIKNKPTVNEDPKDAKLREYKAEIELLKQMLAQQQGRFELQEQIQREKEEIQRQLKLEQESIEKAKADAAEMMEMAHVEKELEAQRLQQEQVDARERELQSIRENEIARTREVEETKAKAAEMMRKAERMMEEAMARAAQPPKVKIVKEVVEVVREVVPDDHVKEKEALKEMNQTMLIHRDQMAKELERTHLAMEHHLREKSELASKLAKIGSQICGTKHDDDKVDAEVAILKQQIKLKMKKKKEMQLEIAQQALQAEKQSVEEELKTAQEQAQVNNAAYKKKQSKYKAKLEAAKEEVADLHKEFARERESLMDTIHQQTREVKLMEQLVELFLPHNELIKVWEKAVWNDDKDEYVGAFNHGMDLLIPLNDVKTKLPSATKSARRDKCDDSIEGTSKKAAASSSRKKEKKKKDKLPRDDALQNNGGGPLNSLSPSLEPLIHASAHKTPDDDKDADGEGKSKRKKKRDKGDRTKDSAPPVSAPSVDVNLAHSLAAPSPEDPDNDDVWEDFP
ncbi:hypothetical protein DYB32_006324 [Aphanomyces invadans]|uniref:Kinesin motor domain-containing protein n=1 Tax=Aphanomyces invadans TaxID=157072 RepID=A0A418AS01_9STRA|nr:hypothetical protein DYB32_006324 [Aphanomyces invadans]